MADEINPAIAAAGAPGQSPVAPVAAEPAAIAAPVAAVPAAGAEVAAPAATPAADAKPAEPAREPTLLEQFDAESAAKAKEATDKAAGDAKAAAAKPETKVETKPEAKPEAKPDDKAAAAAEAPPAAAVEFKPVAAADFKLPDTLRADEGRIGAFTGLLNEAKAPAAIGQKLLDMHADAMTAYAEKVLADQFSTFNKTRAEWRKMTMADSEIGGAGHQTALAAAARMRDLLVSSAKPGTKEYDQHMKEFRDFDAATGASDHPALTRLLHNVARYLDEPQASSIQHDIKPARSNGRGGRLSDVLHDNPRSHQARQT